LPVPDRSQPGRRQRRRPDKRVRLPRDYLHGLPQLRVHH
jgi:hypothetical protein